MSITDWQFSATETEDDFEFESGLVEYLPWGCGRETGVITVHYAASGSNPAHHRDRDD